MITRIIQVKFSKATIPALFCNLLTSIICCLFRGMKSSSRTRNDELTPGSLTLSELKMIYKGSEAAERNGVDYVISDKDHPATKLLQSPLKISKGMSSSISLSLRKVKLKLRLTLSKNSLKLSNQHSTSFCE